MDMREQKILQVQEMARRMRQRVLKMGFSAGVIGAHFGSGLSIVELMAVLYGAILKLDSTNPYSEERDRFILSKGHGSLGFYTGLAEAGFLSEDDLATFEKPEGFLPGQPQMYMPKGIEFSSGSLGHGLSFGIGIALVSRSAKRNNKVYVLMGDGECNEGSVWEAAMSAGYYRLGNLIAVIDRNHLQSDGPTSEIMDMDDLSAKWRSFGWEAVETDGHNIGQLYDTFTAVRTPGKPFVVIANTVKGKGVSFMENNNEWHHNRLTQEQLDAALAEIEKQS